MALKTTRFNIVTTIVLPDTPQSLNYEVTQIISFQSLSEEPVTTQK